MNNIITLLLLLIVNFSVAQQIIEQKHVVKSFPHRAGKQIEISNKYGMVQLQEWDKDSIGIEIKIQVSSDNKKDVAEIMSGIDFKFVNTTLYLEAATVFYNETSSFFKDFKKVIVGKSHNITIDYIVYLPKTNDFELFVENKYGDIYGADFNVNVKFSISYGKLKLHDCNAKLDLDLNFADASINDLSNAKILLNYSDIKIGNVKYLELNSKSSKIEINTAKNLKLISKRDVFSIESANQVELEGWYTDVYINKFIEKFYANSKYGLLNVRGIKNGFNKFIVNSKYTDLTFTLEEPETSYLLDIAHRKCELNLPKRNCDTKQELINIEEERYLLKGKVGLKTEPESFFSLNVEYGVISIIH
ncbi:MAG: hypothetical protein IPO21_06905 [Bacteroidales bacterium]|nr:hypothetical protein [Bacteroidales bacterium]